MKVLCIKCKKGIIDKVSGLCNKCSQKYLYNNDFLDLDPENHDYWGELKQEEMRFLIETSKRDGYKKACLSFFSNNPGRKDLLQYILNENERVNFITPIYNESTNENCLDIGSGLGAIPSALCKKFKNVYSIELIKERVLFQTVRKKQDHLNNWNIIKSNIKKLPFSDNFFDFISINGVLEWVAIANFSDNPQKIQEKFLNEVKRVLKPDGICYIGIENRFSYLYIKGSLDHNGLKYTSLLPRPIANFVSFIREKNKNFYYQLSNYIPFSERFYRTYTYSKNGYINLLKKINIQNIEMYHIGPSYDFINTMINDRDLIHIPKNRKIVSKLFPHFKFSYNKLFAKISGVFSPNFSIYFTKTDKSILPKTNNNIIIHQGFNSNLLLDLKQKKIYRFSKKDISFLNYKNRQAENIIEGKTPKEITLEIFKDVTEKLFKDYYNNIYSDNNKIEELKNIIRETGETYGFKNTLIYRAINILDKYSNSYIFSKTHGDLWRGNIIIKDNKINLIDEENTHFNIFILDILRFILSISGYEKPPSKNKTAAKYINLLKSSYPNVFNNVIFDDFYLISIFQEIIRYDINKGIPRSELLYFYKILKNM